MSYKSISSSFYQNKRDNNPTLVCVHDFLTDQSYENIIDRLRECTDPEEAAAIKGALPAMTISVICKGSHANKVKHTSLLCVDIDGKDNPHVTDWVSFVHSLRWMPNVWFCGLSAGGRGCFLVIGIKYPAKHKEHFRSIQRFFRDDQGIEVDSQCANENRLRFQSFNTEETSWFNHSAKVWKSQVTNCKEPIPEIVLPSPDASETALRVEQRIRILADNEVDITEGENWLKIGCAFITEFGDRGRKYFHEVSRFHPKYDYTEADQKYSYWMTRKYPYAIRTFFYICNQAVVINAHNANNALV